MRVPNFQRGFVWDPERVAYLMDSIYKGYPFGSILLWRTKQALTYERNLGPFELPKNDPSYPTDYILDGQQRITSIFGTFQTEIKLDDAPLWTRIYYDLASEENAQDSSFVALEGDDIDRERYFKISSLFDPVRYRKETEFYKSRDDIIAKLDEIQARFKEAIIPVQTITTEDKTAVAIVFERVNQRGVELDTVQLLSAWTWSGDFDLNQKFEELANKLSPFGFRDAGADKDLLLRCCSAVLTGDPSAESLVKLNGSVVRNSFNKVISGLEGAIDFLRKNIGVHSLRNLPYDNILVPLCVFFSGEPKTQKKVTERETEVIVRWFWRTCLARRYNSQPIKNLKEDVAAFQALKDSKTTSLPDAPLALTPSVFTKNNFRTNSVLSKTYVLMLIQLQPKSFVSGGALDLGPVLKEYNRNEFHHIYPKAFVRTAGASETKDTMLANMTIMSRVDNNALGGVAPSIYRALMPANISKIEQSHLLPPSTFADDFDQFLADRAALLLQFAQKLTV